MIVLLTLNIGLFIGCAFGFILGVFGMCWLIDNGKSDLYVKRKETEC